MGRGGETENDTVQLMQSPACTMPSAPHQPVVELLLLLNASLLLLLPSFLHSYADQNVVVRINIDVGLGLKRVSSLKRLNRKTDPAAFMCKAFFL
jgi:hypothetical protein